MAQTQIIVNIDPNSNTFTLNDAVPIPSGTPINVTKISANYSVSDSDATVINIGTAASAITITLPNASLYPNRVLNLSNANVTTGGTVTLSPAVNVANGSTLSSMAVNSRIAIQSDGTNWWQIL